jgi:hypothetical protein
MSDSRSFWEQVERIFDHASPIQDPSLFAARDPWYDPSVDLYERLRRSSAHSKYLLATTEGSGNTSMLFHLCGRLATDRSVIFFDVYDHFVRRVCDPRAIDRVEPWELLGLLGLAIVRAGEDRFGHRWGNEPKALEQALCRLRQADGGNAAEIDVATLAKGLTIAVGGGTVDTGLQVLDVAPDTRRWSWRIGLTEDRRRLDQEPDVRALLHAVNGLLMQLQRDFRRLLVVVDGIDRIWDSRRPTVLFSESSLLGELVCDEVITAPCDLLSGAARRATTFRVHALCNVPVLSREDPSKPGPGLGFFRAMVDKRIETVKSKLAEGGLSAPCDAPIPRHVVDRLAYYSGGSAREFVRMVAFAAMEAWDARAEALTDAMVDVTLRDARTPLEFRITSDEIELLERVMLDPEHELPTEPLAYALLQQQRLLRFPNDPPWYYPNPLLTLALLKPGRSNSAARSMRGIVACSNGSPKG